MAKIDEHIKVMMLKGETGANIKSIDKTATDGLVDTYTVTLTDGTKSNFTVTNGRDGKDGADFDTFEIGGRNLLSGSKDFSGANVKAPTVTYSTETVSGVDCTVLSLDNSKGDAPDGYLDAAGWAIAGIGTAGAAYTASFWFKGSGECDMYFCGPSGHTLVSRAVMTINGTTTQHTSEDGGVVFIKHGSTVSDWTRCTVVYTLSNTVGSTTDKYILWRAYNGSKLSIALPMLERSTRPSDWTPAPDDKADVSALAGKADVSTIVPKASVESSTTASQAYAAGQYVVVGGILRMVKSAIAKGNTISDSNSTATTVAGELTTLGESVSRESFEQNGVCAERFGKVVTLTIATSSVSISDNWGKAEVCVLPWQPTGEADFAVTLQGGGSGVIGRVGKDGCLWIIGKDTGWRSGWLFGSTSYVCE